MTRPVVSNLMRFKIEAYQTRAISSLSGHKLETAGKNSEKH